MDFRRLNFGRGLFRVWIVLSAIWLLSWVAQAVDSYITRRAAAKELLQWCGPSYLNLPEGYCLVDPTVDNIKRQVQHADTLTAGYLAVGLFFPIAVLVGAMLTAKIVRWVIQGFRVP